MSSSDNQTVEVEDRQSFDVDIACVGFGPACGGFLTRLSESLWTDEGLPRLESRAAPGMPLQIACYERADDIAYGVSGVATRGRALQDSFDRKELAEIPMAAPIREEKVLYLLDPVGASRRSAALRGMERLLSLFKWLPSFEEQAWELPYIPPFLRKEEGWIFSIGQLNQWVGSRLMEKGSVSVWPASPVRCALIADGRVEGIRLMDQGTDRKGQAESGFMPGMDVRADLTVVGDGPVGAVGRQLDEHFGLPDGHHQREWAVGAKMVIDLPPDVGLKAGTILHTLGYPEPEIFGFMYAHSDQLVSVGIFVPSWFHNPARTSYRYLQHWMRHPYLWRYLEGGTLRSWGAKSLQESGKRGEPYLAGDGYARIGEGSGSTNVLTGSGVDEAWATGEMLAEAVIELAEKGESFSRENLERTYVRRRRDSWVEKEGRIAEKARDGFQRGFVTGLVGMALSGLSGGRWNLTGRTPPVTAQISSPEDYYEGRFSQVEWDRLRKESEERGVPLHDLVMESMGWPEIPFDGKLLMSQQDALLMGGKVQAAPGYADHVTFLYPEVCEECGTRVCVEMCSGQAIESDPEGGVRFDREKCVHCGACLWNCSARVREGDLDGNIDFQAGSGGLHSAEN